MAWMFYDVQKITEDEPFVKPAGERVNEALSERPEEVKKMEARFAKKYQEDLFKPVNKDGE